MAVPVVEAVATTNLGNASSHAINLPAHSEGDLLLMALYYGTYRTVTLSGWDLVASGADAVGAHILYVFEKVAGASEGSTVTATANGLTAAMAWVAAISGAEDPATTAIVFGSTGGNSGVDQVAPSITATDADSLIIVGTSDSGGTGYGGTLSGYTLMANLQNDTSFDDCVAFYRDTGAAAGTVSAVTVSANTLYPYRAFQMAIAPASGASYIPAFVHHRRLLGVQ